MSFDASRFTFDAWNDYLGVVMQQGRVQLDSDWNEWVAEVMRRLQAGTVDILGTAAVPQATTPNGFLITPSNNGTTNVLTIGRGRIYVDGLLAENHGLPTPSPLRWVDGSGRTDTPRSVVVSGPGRADGYERYPVHAATVLSVAPCLAHRCRAARRLPRCLAARSHAPAAARSHRKRSAWTPPSGCTVWQVKVLADTGAGTTCATDLNGLLAAAGIFPSGAQLTTDIASVAQPTDPCQIPTSSGYKGLEEPALSGRDPPEQHRCRRRELPNGRATTRPWRRSSPRSPRRTR